MRLFYSTCPAGLEKPCEELAAREIASYGARARLSGALIYTARTDEPKCHGFQNTYLQLAKMDNCKNVTHAAKFFMQDRRCAADAERAMYEYGFKTFRVMFSEANRLIQVEKFYRESFENMIRFQTNREKPDTEIIILRRSEGMALLLMRLTRPVETKKGELSPSLAACLASLARPEAAGRFIDPFCGSGAIALARLKICRAKEAHVCDINADIMKRTASRLGAQAKAHTCDSLKLSKEFPNAQFDEIVTDPPWGLYTPLNMDEREFAKAMLDQFSRVLSPYGTCVILTASKDAFSAEIKTSRLTLSQRYDILVNGKKAAVFVLKQSKQILEVI